MEKYIENSRSTHFEEPIAIGIGMRLKRNRSILQVLGNRRRRLRPGRRRGCRSRHNVGPSVWALFPRNVLQVGGRSSFGHDTPFEHPVGRHIILLYATVVSHYTVIENIGADRRTYINNNNTDNNIL